MMIDCFINKASIITGDFNFVLNNTDRWSIHNGYKINSTDISMMEDWSTTITHPLIDLNSTSHHESTFSHYRRSNNLITSKSRIDRAYIPTPSSYKFFKTKYLESISDHK